MFLRARIEVIDTINDKSEINIHIYAQNNNDVY